MRETKGRVEEKSDNESREDVEILAVVVKLF